MPPALPETLTDSEVDLLSPMLHRNGDSWTAEFRGLTLRTALQPIYSISHKRTVGYEALIRAQDPDGSNVLPIHLFDVPSCDEEALLLDRLCRYLHIRNYTGIQDQLNWLFLNVSPRVVTSGSQTDSFFGNLLAKTKLPPHRIVIEIVEQPTDDADRLRETVAYYRKLGCLTAIDDFGAGHSNFEPVTRHRQARQKTTDPGNRRSQSPADIEWHCFTVAPVRVPGFARGRRNQGSGDDCH